MHRQRRPTLEALRRARVDAGLTISDLAKRAGVSRDTISHAERGRHSLQGPTLSKIAQALGRTPSELLAEEERLSPKAESRSSLEPSLFNGLEDERRTPSLRSWIDFAGRMADRWEAEFEEREAERHAAEPHIRRNVKFLPNLIWATEILRTYTDILAAVTSELHYGLYVYETVEVQELFRNTQRLEEVWEHTKPWYSGKEAPRMAEVIDLQRAMAEQVEEIEARSSQSA